MAGCVYKDDNKTATNRLHLLVGGMLERLPELVFDVVNRADREQGGVGLELPGWLLHGDFCLRIRTVSAILDGAEKL